MSSRERLRVAIFTYAVQPRGGVVHALSLAEALVDLGHDAVLFALDDTGGGLFRAPRCPVELVPVARVPNEGIVPFVRRRIGAYVDAFGPAMGGFDAYHVHDGIGANALATLAERGAVASFVRTVHHLDAFAEPELTALQERSVRRAERCLVVSDLWRRRLAERFGIAADVVPSGVDLARFSPVEAHERSALRARLGLTDAPLFIAIGGVEERKNTLGILEAFATVRETHRDAQLAIAGGASVFDHGAYRRAFDERAATLGLRPDIDFTVMGPIPDDGIVALVRAADALVFPSLVEGFGLVVLEALACGTPVVTSDEAPFTEYLARGDALFVDPRDATSIADGMTRSLDPLTASVLRIRGPLVAARHTWAASAVAHVDRYRELMIGKERDRARDAVRGALAG